MVSTVPNEPRPELLPDLYKPVHACDLPPVKVRYFDGEELGITPGSGWECPVCGLFYVAAAGSPERYWISTGTLSQQVALASHVLPGPSA